MCLCLHMFESFEYDIGTQIRIKSKSPAGRRLWTRTAKYTWTTWTTISTNCLPLFELVYNLKSATLTKYVLLPQPMHFVNIPCFLFEVGMIGMCM